MVKVGVPLKGFADFSRKVAADGAVLLKNDNEFLPFKKGEQIAVFGRCQFEYYRSGTGSGGSVNTEYKTDFINSLIERDFVTIDENLKQVYENWLEQNPFDNGGGGWAAEPWSQAEMPLTDEIETTGNKAIVVIGRTAGEDKDNLATAGSYYLTDDELSMIEFAKSRFDKVGIVLNVGNIINMANFDADMIIYAWHGGMEGGNAIVDVLVGDVNPSGKLPNTIAEHIDDYPSTINHGGTEQNIYQEDIYIGYRYFETFGKNKVMYPFGFGLSYTTFDIKNITGTQTETGIKVFCEVQNTGTYSGKEVVQVYAQLPQANLGKPAKTLVGFVKTGLLAPNETQNICIEVLNYTIASYDDSGITGYKSAYVLEDGEYIFHVGNSIRNTEIALKYFIAETRVIEQCQEAMAPTQSFTRMRPFGNCVAYENVPTKTVDLAQRIEENISSQIEITGDVGIKLVDVTAGKNTIEEFVAQLTIEDLQTIVRGEGMSHPQVTPGTASAFGGVTNHLRSLGIPLMCTADGPSGLRMESGLKSTQLPIGTLLASTWDAPLIEQLYEMEGQELKSNYVDVLLGPGLNIHRSPLNGRNFEYFSEDPLLTGKMSSAIVRGISAGGAIATLKHFACNSQETYRHDINSVVSERAIREIYLKGFEIAVKEGNAKSIMTAYNPINGIWTASNYDLNTTILRNEWKFDGLVMTDWWARMNDCVTGGEGTRENVASMVKSQNDVYMVVGNYGAENNENNDNLSRNLEEGKSGCGRCSPFLFCFLKITK
ncbi:MAG: beta-glucosidase [Epulopiscium sp. Nele67-Bin005]|nr:MAG: beta-glucosidase [Epulopiscium sp. Nele67-Bin005]